MIFNARNVNIFPLSLWVPTRLCNIARPLFLRKNNKNAVFLPAAFPRVCNFAHPFLCLAGSYVYRLDRIHEAVQRCGAFSPLRSDLFCANLRTLFPCFKAERVG
jgi:hypothetical protein